MDIFESLENLNVSEECFDSIMGIVEEIISENIYQAIEDKWGKAKYTTKGRPQNKAAKKIRRAAATIRHEIDQGVR